MKFSPGNVDLEKAQKHLSNFLRFTLLVAVVLSLYLGRWNLAFSTSLVFLLTYGPYLIKRRYHFSWPIEFETTIVVFIFTSLFLGDLHGYYTRFWWWDVVLHTGSGLALGFAGFLVLYSLLLFNKVEAKPIWIALFAFCFALAVGALWEIFEFFMDYSFGFNMQKSGLVDTMMDLVADAIGAFITSVIGFFYMRGRRSPIFSKLLARFI